MPCVKADMTKIVPLGWTKTGIDADDVLWIARDGSTRLLTSKSTGYFVEEEYLPSVWEADVATGVMNRIQKSQENVVDWDADGDGNVRLGYLATSDDRLGVRASALSCSGPERSEADRPMWS